ncbi:MAG: hypothetical protein JO306_04705 [Gemmatimonadetes bacterium]|nr:hypothetical protein [Gemmatimonadota bacterium]
MNEEWIRRCDEICGIIDDARGREDEWEIQQRAEEAAAAAGRLAGDLDKGMSSASKPAQLYNAAQLLRRAADSIASGTLDEGEQLVRDAQGELGK